jgi:hypothetical protein
MRISGSWFILTVCLLGAGCAWILMARGPAAPHPNATDQNLAGVAQIGRIRIVPQTSRFPAPADIAQASVPGDNPGNGDGVALNNEPAAATPNVPDLSGWYDLRAWVSSHPTEAVAWLTNAPGGPKRDAISEMVCFQMAQTNPAQALALVEPLGGSHSAGIMQNVMMQWAENDLQAAYDWASARPPGQDRDVVLSSVAIVQARSNPSAAANLVSGQITPGTIQTEAAMNVLYQWAPQDVNAAMSWAQSFPPGTLRDRAIQEVGNVGSTAGRAPAAF